MDFYSCTKYKFFTYFKNSLFYWKWNATGKIIQPFQRFLFLAYLYQKEKRVCGVSENVIKIGKGCYYWKNWKSIINLEALKKVKVNVHIWTTRIWTTPNWTNPIWTSPHFDQRNGSCPKILSAKWGWTNILELATPICFGG